MMNTYELQREIAARAYAPRIGPTCQTRTAAWTIAKALRAQGLGRGAIGEFQHIHEVKRIARWKFFGDAT